MPRGCSQKIHCFDTNILHTQQISLIDNGIFLSHFFNIIGLFFFFGKNNIKNFSLPQSIWVKAVNIMSHYPQILQNIIPINMHILLHNHNTSSKLIHDYYLKPESTQVSPIVLLSFVAIGFNPRSYVAFSCQLERQFLNLP